MSNKLYCAFYQIIVSIIYSMFSAIIMAWKAYKNTYKEALNEAAVKRLRAVFSIFEIAMAAGVHTKSARSAAAISIFSCLHVTIVNIFIDTVTGMKIGEGGKSRFPWHPTVQCGPATVPNQLVNRNVPLSKSRPSINGIITPSVMKWKSFLNILIIQVWKCFVRIKMKLYSIKRKSIYQIINLIKIKFLI